VLLPSHVSEGGGALTLSTDASPWPGRQALHVRRRPDALLLLHLRDHRVPVQGGGRQPAPGRPNGCSGPTASRPTSPAPTTIRPVTGRTPARTRSTSPKIMGHDLTTVHQGSTAGRTTPAARPRRATCPELAHLPAGVVAGVSGLEDRRGRQPAPRPSGPLHPMFLIIARSRWVGGGTVDPSTLPRPTR